MPLNLLTEESDEIAKLQIDINLHGVLTGTKIAMTDMIIMATMITTLVWLGSYPQPVFDTASSGLANLQRVASEHLSVPR